jgi:DNA polymerase-3 subunit chi
MARTDFYLLGDGTSRTRFACTLANKVWKQGHRLHILASSREEAAALDDLLWTFQDISFLPHAVADDADAGTPVTVGWPDVTAGDGDVLINLTEEIPESAADFGRVAEIVGGEEDLRRRARSRYKQYRDRGFELHTHDMSAQ